MCAFAPRDTVRKFFIRAGLLTEIAAMAALLTGQTPPDSSASSPAPAVPVAFVPLGLPTAASEHLFLIHCAPCHGPHGEGAVGPTLAAAHLPRASSEEALLKIITRGIEGTEMPRSRLEPDEIRQVAAWVWQLGKIAPEKIPGDAGHGRQLYFAKGGCVQCHSIGGHGGSIGPDLTDVGLRRGASYLRRALVDPGADVPKSFSSYRSEVSLPDNFLLVRVVTKDGREITGVRINEDTFSIQLRDFSSHIHSFFKSDLAELHKDWGQSPMPPYGAVFTPAELDDLVAFLSSLRGEP
ncbi:MAG TPA: c-type cytochrome [Opitutaceae bacterium]|nr:c-type cytochrome [Opitutaceae bacterium]